MKKFYISFSNYKRCLYFLVAFCISISCFAYEAEPIKFVKYGFFYAGLNTSNSTKKKCEAKFPNRCWYVDGDATKQGNGSYEKPFNSFEKVIGYRTTKKSYVTGKLKGGDHLYLTGTFDMADHIEDGGKTIRLFIGNPSQGGTEQKPTVIKSMPGKPRAIFEGRHRRIKSMDVNNSGLIHIRTSYNKPVGKIVIENIEVKNADGIGISFDENVLSAEINNVEIHNTNVRRGNASSGAIHFRMTHDKTNFEVKNSLFYQNYRKDGGVGFLKNYGNNVGAINILTAPEADTGSSIKITNNIFHDEIYAVRHKKSGNISTVVANNYITDSKVAFYIRAFKNDFHHNIVDNVSTAVLLSAENQHGDIAVKIRNNTVIDTEKLFDTGYEIGEYKLRAELRRNIFSSSLNKYPLGLHSGGQPDSYPLDQIISSDNIFDIPGDILIKHEKNYYRKYESLTKLKDYSTVFNKIWFYDSNAEGFLKKYVIDTNVTKKLSKPYNIGALY